MCTVIISQTLSFFPLSLLLKQRDVIEETYVKMMFQLYIKEKKQTRQTLS